MPSNTIKGKNATIFPFLGDIGLAGLKFADSTG